MLPSGFSPFWLCSSGFRRAACVRIFVAAAFLFATCLLLPSHGGCAEASGTDKLDKTAVVLAGFGTTYEQKDDPFALLKAEIEKRRPGLRLCLAYTSDHVRKILRAKGVDAKTPAQVLADLSAEGYTRVVVQSLHVTPGLEYDLTAETAKRFAGLPKGIRAIEMGRPLIASHKDADRLSALLLASLPKEYKAGDCVLFVGHGAQADSGSLAYPALLAFLQQRNPTAFVGTLEGAFDLDYAHAAAARQRSNKVWLVPLLTLIGDHASNDIFGDDKDSWKQELTKGGFSVIPVRQGLFSLPGVAAMFADHLEEALDRLP